MLLQRLTNSPIRHRKIVTTKLNQYVLQLHKWLLTILEFELVIGADPGLCCGLFRGQLASSRIVEPGQSSARICLMGLYPRPKRFAIIRVFHLMQTCHEFGLKADKIAMILTVVKRRASRGHCGRYRHLMKRTKRVFP